MKLNTICIILVFILFKPDCKAQIFTYDLEKLCEESKVTLEHDNSEQIELILLKTIPALTNYLDQGETQKYLELKKCSKIDSLLYNQLLFASSEKVEAYLIYDILHLKYLRYHSPDEWVIAYIKKIKASHNIVTVTSRAIEFNPNFTESEKMNHKKKLALSTISNLQDNFSYASSICIEFTKDQKEIQNNFIEDLLFYKPSLLSYLCK